MKVTDVKTWAVANKRFQFGGPYWIFVKLTTDDGITGYGEAYGAPFSAQQVCQLIEEVAERYVVGYSPFDIEMMWRAVYGSAFNQHPDVTIGAILSSLEIACWDIVGKASGQPVYNLLGGKFNERLRTYTYMFADFDDPAQRGVSLHSDPDLLPKRAEHYAKLGFTAVGFDPVMPSGDPRQLSLRELSTAELVTKNLRDAVGDGVDLLVKTHGQMTTSSAIRLARRLEKFDPLWFEEPVPPENRDEVGRVAQMTTIPVATGERLVTKYEFWDLLKRQGAAILQPALGKVGGILEAKKIASMAEANYAQIAPHLYAGPIVAAANIQLSTCSPNFLVQECIERADGFFAEILKKPIQWEHGYIIPSSEPGIGHELDEAVADANPYTKTNVFPPMGPRD